MRKIVLHGPQADNAGKFCDAGEEMKVGDQAEAGFITAARADALLASGGAVTPATADREERQADDAFDPAPFSARHTSGGRYLITGPGLDEAEKVSGGKAAMQARVTELKAALPPSLPAAPEASADKAPAGA